MHADNALARPVPGRGSERRNVLSPVMPPVTERMSMSDSYLPPVSDDTANRDETSSLETAKQEASDLKQTAVTEAGHVAETAKSEAGVVAREVTSQAKDLYAQTQRELKDQAQVQQQRVASGLRSVSEELDSMTANAENPGLAADLLRQAAGRISGAAAWLGDRDPGSLLTEVKSFARRRPGTFIIGAAVLGVAAGRLTRALAANASDERSDSAAAAPASPTTAGTAPTTSGELYATPPTVEETPVFAQSSAARSTELPREEARDVRSDSF
ncbi:hypothetical protein [Microbacterium sp. zg-B185]|uniref:hypothetical protein n=1 Tax=Microbacterium sp. zg-B185 TaxID=3049070 RepID=UPI00254A1CE4|nr:hypothetical protein [Microbacterium sp. zg-B185]WIM18863.1 hypothetical protein QNO12_14955 [Microbacterium sp. zg-B185]